MPSRIATKNTKPTGTGALDKGLNLLALVCDSPQPQRFTDLLKETKLPKATLHRLLGALVAHKLLAVDDRDGTYRVGLRALEMAQKSWEGLDIRGAAADEILWLGDETGETVHLAVIDDIEVVYIDKVESRQRIRMFSAIGKRGPLHCTGVGKAMLAFVDEAARGPLIDRLPLKRFTQHTFAAKTALVKHLAEIRRVGYAKDLEEHELGIRCAAAPIFDYRGRVVASVSVTAPSFRLTLEHLEKIAPAVVTAARNITRKLGGRA
ncbi:HTH-type transcriptional regulator XynR [Usitatibacter rugosus]|uniref:HTH-type transcriptional regulator XynR n=1 Tax=Usitatibacter rugosus TaxID=2732067 RepID=A0A6M4GS16_9PROT|nr:IclR family transcriptional regulator [Usitatibacter rugosus]QJR09608.1 HTH-type transcriptional regulator XynR [Usitatibacter rugosus]